MGVEALSLDERGSLLELFSSDSMSKASFSLLAIDPRGCDILISGRLQTVPESSCIPSISDVSDWSKAGPLSVQLDMVVMVIIDCSGGDLLTVALGVVVMAFVGSSGGGLISVLLGMVAMASVGCSGGGLLTVAPGIVVMVFVGSSGGGLLIVALGIVVMVTVDC